MHCFVLLHHNLESSINWDNMTLKVALLQESYNEKTCTLSNSVGTNISKFELNNALSSLKFGK